jgi:hypothetical protein
LTKSRKAKKARKRASRKPMSRHAKQKPVKRAVKRAVRKKIHHKARTHRKPSRKKPNVTLISRPPPSHFHTVDNKNVLETEIDQLYDIVKERKKVKMDNVAKQLGVPKEQVQEWADIMEDHQMVKTDYPVVGEPVIMLKEHEDEIKKKVQEIDRKHEKNPSKKPVILILAVGAAVLIYFSNLRYMIWDSISPVIGQNPEITAMLWQNWMYLALGIAVIIALAVVLKNVKFRKKRK